MQVIDMHNQQKYSFTLYEGHSFKIYYGTDVKISTEEITLTQPFPNPAVEGKSNFTLGLPDSNNSYLVNLQIFNSSGVTIDSDSKNLSGGIQTLQWQANESVAPGLYLYRISVCGGDINFISSGKILVP